MRPSGLPFAKAVRAIATMVAAALWLSGINALPALAQEMPELFPAPPIPSNARPFGMMTGEVEIDSGPVARGLDRFRLYLPDGTAIEVERSGMERRGAKDMVWRGTVANVEDSRVVLTLKQGVMAGSVTIGEIEYELRPRAGGRHILREREPEQDGWDHHIRVPGGQGAHGPDQGAGPGQDGATGPQASAADTTEQIHLLSVYTAQARLDAGGTAAIEATIQSWVDYANTAFIDSIMTPRYVLVGTAEIAYSDSGNLGTDLVWVRTSQEVAALRNSYGADMVSLIVKDTGFGCGGIGYVQASPGPGFREWAFQATEVDCPGGVFAHEHGHNLGMEHDPANAGTTPDAASFPWSFGHYVDGQFRTIMSYSNPCALGCNRIAKFSNPDISHNGQSTGIAGQRDNAQTGDATGPIAANFFAAVAPGVVNLRISQGSDDAEESGVDGSVDLTGSPDLELVNDGAARGDQVVGLRFIGAGIPPGATITKAFIEFEADETNDAVADLAIQAEYSANAAPFATTTRNLSDRLTSIASVDWPVPAWNTVSEKHWTPDLSTLVQEVVDHPGWQLNNALAFIITGSGRRTAEAYEGEAQNAPLLHVEFSTDPVNNNPPLAAFTFNAADLSVNFTDTSSDSDGSVTAWSWTFGDGGASAQRNPSHNYAAAGSYSVALTVTDNDGATDSTSRSVTVTAPPNNPPTAAFDVITSGLAANFTDRSSDSDGTVASWTWDFGDGQGSTAPSPSHGYAADGTYSVRLTVTDNDGSSDSQSRSVTVTASKGPPQVTIETPAGNTAVSAATTSQDFSGLAEDNDGSVAQVQYRLNGAAWQTATGTASWSFTVSPLQAGDNQVEVRALDDGGAVSPTPYPSRTITRNAGSCVVLGKIARQMSNGADGSGFVYLLKTASAVPSQGYYFKIPPGFELLERLAVIPALRKSMTVRVTGSEDCASGNGWRFGGALRQVELFGTF